MKKTKLYFNKPVYLGMTNLDLSKELYFYKPVYLVMNILDLSKFLMYDFHYNKPNMGIRQNCSSPTPTLSHMKLNTNDVYKDINPDIEKWFDTSDCPSIHPSGIKTGLDSKVLGMFKDEAGGKQIFQFVGLRDKLYSYKMLDGSED